MNRINNIMVAYDFDGKPVFLRELRISHAVMKLMIVALNPNLVQTSKATPRLFTAVRLLILLMVATQLSLPKWLKACASCRN